MLHLLEQIGVVYLEETKLKVAEEREANLRVIKNIQNRFIVKFVLQTKIVSNFEYGK